MDYVVIAFLCLAILLYFLLGGADFGAGIIEMFTSPNISNAQERLCTMLLDLYGKRITCG